MFRSILIIILCLLASACTTVQKPVMSGVPQQLQAQLAGLKTWQFSGRVAFKSPQEKMSANINWQQQQQNFNLKLTTFLGIGILEMQGQPGHVQLEVDDEHYQGHNAKQLLYDITGRILPVDLLPLWLKGQKTDNTNAQYTPQGWLKQLQQPGHGWSISYTNYRKVQALWLPHSLLLKQHNQQIKIRINQWKIK